MFSLIVLIVFLIPAIAAFIYYYRQGGNKTINDMLMIISPSIVDRNDKAYDLFLTNHFSYYEHLDNKGKSKFIRRLKIIKNLKYWEGREDFEVTDDVCTYIAACWVKVTFGFSKYKLPLFTTIIIYPQSFYSPWAQGNVIGLTSNKGEINLSWADFLSGYENHADNYNLGIHEISRAIMLTTINQTNINVSFASYIDTWYNASIDELYALGNRAPEHILNYSNNTKTDLFAVCMEHFFEDPALLQAKMPITYNHLCVLLNQNPLNTPNNYSLNTDNQNLEHVILPKKVAYRFKYKLNIWMPVLLFTGLLHWFGTWFVLLDSFISSIDQVVLFALLFAICMHPKIKRPLFQTLGSYYAWLFIVLGIVSNSFAIIIDANYIFRISGSTTKTYHISSYYTLDDYVYKNHQLNKQTRGIQVTLDNEELDSYPDARIIPDLNYLDPDKQSYLVLETHIGMFGIPVVDSKQIKFTSPALPPPSSGD